MQVAHDTKVYITDIILFSSPSKQNNTTSGNDFLFFPTAEVVFATDQT